MDWLDKLRGAEPYLVCSLMTHCPLTSVEGPNYSTSSRDGATTPTERIRYKQGCNWYLNTMVPVIPTNGKLPIGIFGNVTSICLQNG